jgi:Activator of Hsp90 ATPase homolog 1-like protein
MKKWYFQLSEFKAEVGFEFQMLKIKEPGKQYLHLFKVTEVIVGKKLTYSWRYEGFEGISYVTFELFPDGNKTRVKLTHEGIESFPADPSFARGNFTAGWTDIIGRSLKEYLEK